MLFPTGEFLVAYLPVTLALFFLIARFAGRQMAAAWLVVASLIFYGSWRADHLLVLGASIVFNYWMGGWILQAREGVAAKARLRLTLAVAANLAALAYFKYTNFLIGTLNDLGLTHLARVDVALPLGISFFTFTQIAYLVDVYAGRAVERSPVKYALFVTYFPHLVAGPVLHHSQMMPQFGNPEIYRPELRSFWTGMSFLFVGMVKKVLVADSFAPVAGDVFGQASVGAIGSAQAWAGILAYTNQIYFDFSGYSDMAVGLALLFGIRLPYNFNSPYKAANIVDFWRRWHISLSSFLRDYLYIALGGNRKGKARRYINLLVTMVLGGLWHGAAWTFVIWGALHGLFLVINHLWRWFVDRSPRRDGSVAAGRLAGFAGYLLTLACVMLAWVFFRADSLKTALRMLQAMFGAVPATQTPALNLEIPVWIALSVVFLIATRVLPNSQELIDGRARQFAARLRPRSARLMMALSVGALIFGALLLAIVSESRNVTEFIYFNF